MKFLGVIPARYSSTRLEGKPLRKIKNKSMIEWVYKRSLNSMLDELVVATDDERIFDEVINFCGKAIMTDKNHENGTARIAEVCKKMPEYDVIINIQGDEPLIESAIINRLIGAFEKENSLEMATLKHQLSDKDEIENPNNVKVICDKNDYALYFSRSVIPFPREKKLDIKYYKHIGIYAYKRDFILKYCKMPKSKLEQIESLEQLRVLENSYKIKVLEIDKELIGVDTEEDLKKVINYIEKNKIEI